MNFLPSHTHYYHRLLTLINPRREYVNTEEEE